MNSKRVLWFIAAGAAVFAMVGVHLFIAQKRADEKAAARKNYLAQYGIETDGRQEFVALPPVFPHDVGKVNLGRQVFCNSRYAGSVQRSCAACHNLLSGGVDGKLHGATLTRSVMGTTFAKTFMSDASLTNLSDVVKRMIESKDYVYGKDMERAVRKIGYDEKLVKAFKINYEEGLTCDTLCDALVKFLNSLSVPRMPFDSYWEGKEEALSADEKEGMRIFQKRNCLSCHSGPMLGGECASDNRKVTALRGISSRQLFLHDGSKNDLGAVITLMPNSMMEGEKRAKLVSFLKSL